MDIYGRLDGGFRLYKANQSLNVDLLAPFSVKEQEYIEAYMRVYVGKLGQNTRLARIEYSHKGFISETTNKRSKVRFMLEDVRGCCMVTLTDAKAKYSKEVCQALQKKQNSLLEDLRWLGYTKTGRLAELYMNRANLGIVLDLFSQYFTDTQRYTIQKYLEVQDGIGLPLHADTYLRLDRIYKNFRADYMVGVYKELYSMPLSEQIELIPCLGDIPDKDVFIISVCIDSIIEGKKWGNPEQVHWSMDLLQKSIDLFNSLDYRAALKTLAEKDNPNYKVLLWLLTGRAGNGEAPAFSFDDIITLEGISSAVYESIVATYPVLTSVEFKDSLQADMQCTKKSSTQQATTGVVNPPDVMELITQVEGLEATSSFILTAKQIAESGRTKKLSSKQISVLQWALEKRDSPDILTEVDYVYDHREQLPVLLNSKKYSFHFKVLETVHQSRSVSEKQGKYIHTLYLEAQQILG